MKLSDEEADDLHDRMTAAAEKLQEEFGCASVAIVVTAQLEGSWCAKASRVGNPYAAIESMRAYVRNEQEKKAWE